MGRMIRAPARLILASALLLAPVAAQDDALTARAHDVTALLVAHPAIVADIFDPAFLQAVPAAKLTALGAQLFAQGGAVRSVSLVHRDSEWSGRFDVELEKGLLMPMTLTITGAEPHRVAGLWFGPPVPLLASLDEVAHAIAALPGRTTFLAARLGDGPPQAIAASTPEQALAIGSAFKLWMLARLARDVRDGQHRWDEVIPLRAAWRSLPSGRLQDWPDGAPITLHTLATAMISESDNTAADHLLFTLGRERVEKLLPELGVRDAEAGGKLDANLPLLSTQELFRIKLSPGQQECATWCMLKTVASRRRYLVDVVAALPLSGPGTDPGAFAAPVQIDRIEWFASAADLVRTLDALRHLAEPVADAPPERDAAPLLGVLSVNPGLPAAREAFAWAGYKGGSETGVLSLNWLLRAGDGQWYALACAWNNSTSAVDEAQLTGLLSRALSLLATQPQPAAAGPH